MSIIRVVRRSVLPAAVLALAACAPVPASPAAGMARTGPTSVPPLVAHQWSQSKPLITMGYILADSGCGFDPQLPADLTLLPDGRLYMLEPPAENGDRAIKSATLSLAETCKLLNSVDQAGFFDYDPATYIQRPDQWTPPVLWAPTNAISVEAWRSKSVGLYWLDGFVNEAEQLRADAQRNCSTCPAMQLPTVLPAIAKTYTLLKEYQPPYAQVYQWDRLGVWLDWNAQNGDALEWPLHSFPDDVPSLTRAGDRPSLILTGEEAATVYELFRWRMDTCGLTVLHTGKYYRAFARPLLPNEYPSAPLPAVSLSCAPEDGLLELP